MRLKTEADLTEKSGLHCSTIPISIKIVTQVVFIQLFGWSERSLVHPAQMHTSGASPHLYITGRHDVLLLKFSNIHSIKIPHNHTSFYFTSLQPPCLSLLQLPSPQLNLGGTVFCPALPECVYLPWLWARCQLVKPGLDSWAPWTRIRPSSFWTHIMTPEATSSTRPTTIRMKSPKNSSGNG